jgi:hypothetical protein
MIFLLPQVGAADSNEPENLDEETLRVQREFGETVEKYNMLFKQGRFDDAIELGKVARVLQPENPMSELMVIKAKFAKQDAINKLTVSFKVTVAAELPEIGDRLKTIKEVLQIASETIQRLVDGKDEDTADGRCMLIASLERQIEAVDLICRLTDTQTRKLRLAGRGDIKRFFDRVEALRPKAERTQDDLQLCGNACFIGRDTDRPPVALGLFEQGSLFSKTLKTVLTAGQAAEFDASMLRSQDAGE